MFSIFKHLDLNQQDLINVTQIQKYQDFQWFVEVKKLAEGGSFGELALLNDKPRAATIQCLTNCEFAVINRQDYQNILERIENRNIKSKIDFFTHLPFAKFFTKNQIQKLIYSFNLEKFKRN